MSETIALIDGHSLFHRAFFALPHLANRRGQPTGAVFGFLTMLFKLLDEENPDCLAVVFDTAAPTFRHQAFERYKAHRPEMADELRSQAPLLREALAALRVPVYECAGYEADDVLGRLAAEAVSRGWRVLLVSGDRDLLQLVGPRVSAVLTRKGISEMEVFDEAAVREKYGLEPRQLIDVKALMGDPSDNIPGVPGIGEKTALDLIRTYGSLEGVYAHLDELRGRKVGESLAAHREAAEMSRRLATIVTDVPVDADLEECRRREPDRAALRRLFTELEFKSLLKRLDLGGSADGETEGVGAAAGAVGVAAAAGAAAGGVGAAAAGRVVPAPSRNTVVEAADIRFVDIPEAAREGVAEAVQAGRMALAVSWAGADKTGTGKTGPGRPGPGKPGAGQPGTGNGAGLAGVAWLPGAGERVYVWMDGLEGLPAEALLEALAPALADPSLEKAGHDVKPLWRFLRRQGRGGEGLAFDTAVAAYLLEPTRSGYPLDDLVERYLGAALPDHPDGGGEERAAARRLAARTAAVARLWEPMAAELTACGLDKLYREIELPLVPVLADMEAAGILVDPAVLDELGREFRDRIGDLAGEIHGLAGTEFNINSPQQLGEILFGRMGLPRGRKTKTGWSTDAAVLESLAREHPVAARVLEYRHLVKLLGTYVDGLKPLIDPATGRVHTTFNQTVTATGRLSSTEPNLQNIPVRESLGRRLRRAFVAPPGWLLLAADYSQIELRLLAHFSGDEGLIRAFREGADIHRATAAEVFGVEPEAVTEEMRYTAKTVNFSSVYGVSDFGLAQNLNITRAEARAFLERYFARFPGVRRYMDEIIARARREGVVRTLYNRLRHLPEINSRNPARRQFAERTALNTPIQGTAADIIKLAMIAVHRELRARRLRSRLILQVHDELILEVPEDEVDTVPGLVVEKMESVADLAVPLKVEAKVGASWYEV